MEFEAQPQGAAWGTPYERASDSETADSDPEPADSDPDPAVLRRSPCRCYGGRGAGGQEGTAGKGMGPGRRQSKAER